MRFNKFFEKVFFWGLEYYGRFYSTYRGFVVDNEDPEFRNRLRIFIPELMNKPLKKWISPKDNYSGKDYGIKLTPEKKSVVWVEFEYGDLRRPVWSQGYFLKEQVPDEFKKHNLFAFKTPKGNIVRIDDEEEFIEIQKEDGRKVLINKKGISLVREGESIFLGGEDKADEKAVLGKKLTTLLNNLSKNLKIVQLDLTAFNAAYSTATANPSPLFGQTFFAPSIAPLSKTLGSLTKTAADLDIDIKTILSENVKLDK